MAFIDDNKFIIKKDITPPPQSIRIVLHGIPAFIPLSGMIDIEKQKSRIRNVLDKSNAEFKKIEKKLQSEFATKAPKDLVDSERQKLEALRVKIDQFKDQIETLK